MTFRISLALPLLPLFVLLSLASPAHADEPLRLSIDTGLENKASVGTTAAEAPAAANPEKMPAPSPANPATNNGSGPNPVTASTSEAGSSLPTTELTPHPELPHAIDLTKTPDDLFVRIRNGFGMPNLNDDIVLTQQQWYLNRPDYLRRMVDRSARYLHHIVEELESRGMPTELAFLPMVESAYNPMAYSRAHASGLWQFIPSTGKNYKLKQNWWIDERRDIVAATSAALDYLQTIYEMHGDWFLALASYNWGEGAVARAIKKNEARGQPTDYLNLTMPAETRNYVPKLQALKNIFSNPQLLAQLDLPSVPNRPYFATVTPRSNIDVKVAARLAEMPVTEFIALNPAHNRPVIKSDATLVIPAGKVDTFHANLENHQDEDKPLSKWQTYTLKSGEKLEKIAPRFGIAIADLKRVNGLSGRLKVTAGMTLLVPATDGVTSADMAALPEQPRLPSADPTPASSKSVLARKGDTLATIAKRTGISVAELRRINGLKGDRIAPGTRITLATAASPGKARDAAPTAAKTNTTARSKGPRVTRYTVKRGDTIHSIARQFKVDHKDLLRWNASAAKGLKPGQQLTIQLAQNN